MNKPMSLALTGFTLFLFCATAKNYTRDDLAFLSAVKSRNYEYARTQMGKGIDLTVEDRNGKNAVYYALRNGNVDFAKYCMAKGIPLKRYVITGGQEKPLLPDMIRHAYPGKDGKAAGLDYLLHETGDPGELVNERLGDGRMTPLMLAAAWGSAGCLRTMLQYGPDLSITDNLGRTVLDLAYYRERHEIAEELLARRAPMTKNWVLINSIVYNNPAIAREALRDGANPNAPVDTSGNTPLTLAIQNRRAEIARMLLDHGVSPKRSERCYYGPIHYAVLTCDLPMVKLLVEKGANVNEEAENGMHPIYCAHLKRYTDIVRYLESKGAMSVGQVKKLYDERREREYRRRELADTLLNVLSVTAKGIHGFNKGYYESKGHRYTIPR